MHIPVLQLQWPSPVCPSDAHELRRCLTICVISRAYGPQMLIGLCGAELVGPDSVGASEGFLGWIAYLGAANAGQCLCCRNECLCCRREPPSMSWSSR
eukprot:scaffold209560_cov18-Tisochrysis_lutea.AAC.2